MRSIFLIIFIQLANASYQDIELALAKLPEDGRLGFCELAQKYGYKCVRYEVITEDGYILSVFNIEGDRSKPVLFQHGILDASDTFLIRGKKSWVALLADNGYDVWLGNMRGNMHSRRHVFLNPDADPEFWEFSFHEIARHDLPATIDFILGTTNQTQLQAIGHSEGTTVFFILGSEKPEYNYKIKSLICLAPVAYLHHALLPISPLISVLGGTGLSSLLGATAHGELLRNSSVLSKVLKTVCTQGLIGYAICNDALFSVLSGADPEQLEKKIFPVIFEHYPAGTSLKNFMHHVQIFARRKFAEYDYGFLGNLKKYNSVEPPLYNLRNFVMKTIFVVGQNDKLSTVADVKILKKQIPNLVDYYEIPYKKWNHVDFVWGRYLPTYLYDYVLEKLT